MRNLTKIAQNPGAKQQGYAVLQTGVRALSTNSSEKASSNASVTSGASLFGPTAPKKSPVTGSIIKTPLEALKYTLGVVSSGVRTFSGAPVKLSHQGQIQPKFTLDGVEITSGSDLVDVRGTLPRSLVRGIREMIRTNGAPTHPDGSFDPDAQEPYETGRQWDRFVARGATAGDRLNGFVTAEPQQIRHTRTEAEREKHQIGYYSSDERVGLSTSDSVIIARLFAGTQFLQGLYQDGQLPEVTIFDLATIDRAFFAPAGVDNTSTETTARDLEMETTVAAGVISPLSIVGYRQGVLGPLNLGPLVLNELHLPINDGNARSQRIVRVGLQEFSALTKDNIVGGKNLVLSPSDVSNLAEQGTQILVDVQAAERNSSEFLEVSGPQSTLLQMSPISFEAGLTAYFERFCDQSQTSTPTVR